MSLEQCKEKRGTQSFARIRATGDGVRGEGLFVSRKKNKAVYKNDKSLRESKQNTFDTINRGTTREDQSTLERERAARRINPPARSRLMVASEAPEKMRNQE